MNPRRYKLGRNAKRLEQLQKHTVVPTPDSLLDVAPIRKGPSPTHHLDFFAEELEDEPLDDKNTQTKPDLSVRRPSADMLQFRKAQLQCSAALKQSINLVAKQNDVPVDELQVNFDNWPFQDEIQIQQHHYDQSGLLVTHYSVPIEELFPPEEPADNLPTASQQEKRPDGQWKYEHLTGSLTPSIPTFTNRKQIELFLHNTSIRRTTDSNPPVVVVRRNAGKVIRIETTDRYLAYYFTPSEWLQIADDQVKPQVEAGIFILTPTFVR